MSEFVLYHKQMREEVPVKEEEFPVIDEAMMVVCESNNFASCT